MRVCTFLLLCWSVAASAGQIAITFDDAPRADTPLLSGELRTQRLLQSLEEVGVEAWFFVKASNIDEQTSERLRAYTAAGHALANHSFHHQSANLIGADDFLADVTRAHRMLIDYSRVQPFFRAPYLHYGDTEEKFRNVNASISALGYRIGYVTVDNYDWYMDSLLQGAIESNKKVNFRKLKALYIDVLWSEILFYDQIARETLGRSPKHVLLLHENDLAAMFIDDLVAHIRAQGWEVISPGEAYKDKIGRDQPDTLFNKQGRVAAIAHAAGVPEARLRHPAENTDYLDTLFREAGVFE